MIAVTASTSQQHLDRWLGLYWGVPLFAYQNFPENIGMVPAYQKLYKDHKAEDIICFMHDDLEIHEPDWPLRIDTEMQDGVAIIGLGGATGLGDSDIYKTSYRIDQLARIGYRSNQTDWQTHGQHETGSCDVAVVDGFFMAVRTSFLREIGGWSGFPYTFHMYDAYLCLKAKERGYRVRMTGISCTHHGGGTSTTPEYLDWCRERGTTAEHEHQEPHRFIYENFMEILPLRI